MEAEIEGECTMAEERKSVLITSLGVAEGVVTTAVDALKSRIGLLPDEVLTLSTSAMSSR